MTKDVDYQVQFVPLGNGAKETVVLNEDDSYTIFIESALSAEGQQLAFLHAMEHILQKDFEQSCSADNLEKRVHSA